MNYQKISPYVNVGIMALGLVALAVWGETRSKTVPSVTSLPQALQTVAEAVLPQQGFTSAIALQDSGVRLAQHNVLDHRKLEQLYGTADNIPPEIHEALQAPQSVPMHLTADNSRQYLTLLWGVGLANTMTTNDLSPVNGENRYRLAATGGWTLGAAENGGEYFNEFPIVPLTAEQTERVTRLAKQMYRPCCNNHTFFQDCNHGSALLGLLQLGAAQGLSDEELYAEALAFNSFWFPQQYTEMAVLFSAVQGIPWSKVDPTVALSAEYSSSQGWQTNVHSVLAERELLPQAKEQSGCSVEK